MAEGIKSRLDYQQIIQEVYNSVTDALQVTDTTLASVHDTDENALRTMTIGSLVPEAYDDITLTYVAAGNGAGDWSFHRLERGRRTLSYTLLSESAAFVSPKVG